MRLAICSAAVLAMTALAPAAEVKDDLPAAPTGKAWKLVWHDEFDGPALDETKWQIPPDAPRRDAWWMRKAIALDGKGNLAIRALKEIGRAHV